MELRIHSIRMGVSVAHLVETELACTLVDAGMPGTERAVLRRMRKIGREDLKLVYITHAHIDHYGSAAGLRRLTGAALAIHRSDAQSLAHGDSPIGSARGFGRLVLSLMGRKLPRVEATPADLMLDDGDVLDLGGSTATVLHTPGHTDGSSCLIVGGRLAFAGDLLAGRARLRLQSTFATDWSLLPTSLHRLQEANPELVYTSHTSRPARGEALHGIVLQTVG
jgi:glyoxylase-like metal-dependent hydrolase (beta-lactamase superfamily II)